VPRTLRLGMATLLLAVLVALAAYAARGWYARYVTDDFCTAAVLQKKGFVEAMKFHRRSWSGRYSYYAAKAIPESIGPVTTRFMPGLMIVLFGASAAWTLRRVLARQSVLVALLAGAVVVYATIDGTFDVLAINGPLLWETGIITYMLPLVLYTLWAGLFFGSRSAWIASAVLMFIAGGFSETSLAAQCGLTGALTVIALLKRWPVAVRIAAAGFVASIVAAAIVASAPGNVVRMRRLPIPQPVLPAAVQTTQLANSYIGSVAIPEGKALLLVLLCGAIIGAIAPRVNARTALLVALAACCGYVASFAPAAWMMSAAPPPRALQVPNFFFIATLLPACIALGAFRPRLIGRLAPALLVLAIVVPLYSAKTTMETMARGRADAAELERIDAILRASRGRRVTVHSPWAIRERVLHEQREFWTNRCMADYYGVPAVTVTY
jgi:Family of unknown function (DUF6056)